jgi:hypothetical protein
MMGIEEFKAWLVEQGCQVDVTQEEGGNGYEVMDVTVPDGRTAEITVNEPTTW